MFAYLSIQLSDAFTMNQCLPDKVRDIVLWSPSVNNVEMIRKGVFGPRAHSHDLLFYDVWMSLLLIGLSLSLRSRRYILVQ